MVSIKEFLGLYSPKKTIEGYTAALNHFFGFLDVSADEYFDAFRNAETLKQRDEALDKIMLDVARWLKNMQSVGYKHRNGYHRPYAPGTIQSRSGAIRAYLLVNRVDLGRAFWKKMKITGQSLTEDRIPTKDELRRIATHLDFLGRTFFYIQISTGLRIGDMFNLEEKAFDFSKTPTRVRYYNKKIRRWCYAFLTKEATLVVKEWIRNPDERMRIYRNSYKFCTEDITFQEFYEKQTNRDKIFPIADTGIYNRYNLALKKAGLNQRDEHTNIRLLHDHVLRKYVKTTLGRALPEAIADALIGHTGGLNSLKIVYNRHADSIDALAEDFLKAEGELSLTKEVTSSKEIGEFREQLENQDTKMKSMKQENDGLKALVTGLQSLIYGEAHSEQYVPAHLQPMYYGKKIRFSHPDDPTPYYSQEEFDRFLKSDEFLKSKQYQEFLKKIKKNQQKCHKTQN